MKRIPFSIVAFLVLLLVAAPAVADKPAFGYLDVFDLHIAADPRISPDGNTIVYVRHQFDIKTDRRYTNLWRISFDGSDHQPLTSGKSSYDSPRWSPDGNKLAYLSTEEGSKQIFIRWMETGVTTSITNLVEKPGELAWSPDGRRLLFTMRLPAPPPSIAEYPKPPEGAEWAPGEKVIEHVVYRNDGEPGFVDEGYTHIFVVSAEGGAPRQLTQGNYEHVQPAWAADGTSIVFSADRTEEAELEPFNAQIHELDLETGEVIQLTDLRGPHTDPTISPDGRHIAFTGFEDRGVGYHPDVLYVMNRDGSNRRALTEHLDLDIADPKWSADSRSLYFHHDREGIRRVGNVTLNGDFTEVASGLGGSSIGRPYTGGTYSVAGDGRFAISQISAERPAEVAVGRFPRGTEARQITNLNEALFQARAVGETAEFRTDSSVDNVHIHGWILTPPGFDPEEKYPMILEIHGGPYAAYGPSFTPELQLMASRGYVVVYTNPRGSTSYGEEFASYIHHNYPGEDYNDLMDAVDYVVGLGYVDEEKLYITGGSGGGVLTAWTIGRTGRFAAAVVAKPVINWYSFALTADVYPFFARYWFTQMPWDDPMQYHDRSPISLVGNVTTPTMLLTGENDFRTPMAESEQFYQALKLRGIDAALVRIPEAPHLIVTRPSNLIRKVAYITGWFDRY